MIREKMLERDKRQKASDVFGKTGFVFAREGDFTYVFPEIKDLTVEIYELGWLGNYKTDEKGPKLVYRKQDLSGEYIDCSNPLCYNGGFSIGSVLREMVKEKKKELETEKMCQGYEGSPKGKHIYKKCLNFFRIKVTITYIIPLNTSENFND